MNPVIQRLGPGHRAAFWTPLLGFGTFWSSGPDGEQVAEDHVVNLLFDGAYLKHSPAGVHLVDPNHWAFFDRDQPYDHRSVSAGRRTGAYLRYHPALLRQILAELAPDQADAGRFPVATAPASAALLTRWHRALNTPTGPHTEEALLLLAHDLLAHARPHPAHISPRRREAVLEVQQILNRELATTHTLAELGRRVALSPYHLARGFRAHTGRSIHAYRERLRLHRAARALSRRPDLTQLAFQLGFSSHSHFTARFRRYFGVPPSRFTAS